MRSVYRLEITVPVGWVLNTDAALISVYGLEITVQVGCALNTDNCFDISEWP